MTFDNLWVNNQLRPLELSVLTARSLPVRIQFARGRIVLAGLDLSENPAWPWPLTALRL
jgi:hypothetical protein